ncbi:MAG: hypothetical protein HUK08_04275 [Bacteroidaceae bacterium]|nr:hypothetical protein [Bacteroidaceae bacterium]
MKRLILTLLVAVVCCVGAMATVVIVDGTNVRFRLGPSTDYAILTNSKGQPIYPKKGASLTYIATEGNFYKVNYNGQDVYISRDFCHLSETSSQQYSSSAAASSSKYSSSGGLTPFEKKLVGKHMLSLQWISWDYFGSCQITKEGDNNYRCVGEQLSRENQGDFVRIDGYLSVESEKHLVFNGKIVMKIYHINGGNECVREGTFNFVATGKRKYWRMQEMDNPCDQACDYVDIYFKR